MTEIFLVELLIFFQIFQKILHFGQARTKRLLMVWLIWLRVPMDSILGHNQ